jgi:hypothetical protein
MDLLRAAAAEPLAPAGLTFAWRARKDCGAIVQTELSRQRPAMPIIYLYLILAILVAMIAALRGRVWWRWLLLALFITPLIAGLVVMVLPPETQGYPDPGEYEAASPQEIEAPAPDCTLRIIRMSGYRDRNRRYGIYVNGVCAGVIPLDSVVDFQVPSGQLVVEARAGRGGSAPLLIDATPEQRIEIEVTRRGGELFGIWAEAVGSPTYLVLKQRPPVPVRRPEVAEAAEAANAT